MSRQSITISGPNDSWLKAQVEAEEYATKSEAINDLIRQARRADEERARIIAALVDGENSGVSPHTAEEIMKAVLTRRGLDAGL